MSETTTFFTLQNRVAVGLVEFHIKHGSQRFRSMAVPSGQSRRVPTYTSSESTSWYVYATLNGIPVGPTLETRDPSETFTLEGQSWHTATLTKASRPAEVVQEPADPLAVPAAPEPVASVHTRLLAAVEARDLGALKQMGDALVAQRGPMSAEHSGLLHRVATGLGSHDFGSRKQQDEMAESFVVSALDHAQSLPVKHVADLLLSLPDAQPPDGVQRREQLARRSQIAEHWMSAYRRLNDELDPKFDPKDLPLVNVSPPPGASLPSGAAPGSLGDPQHEAAYQAAVAENAKKAEQYEKQVALRDLREPLWAAMSRYVSMAYSRSTPDISELRKLADKHLKGEARLPELLNAPRPTGAAPAAPAIQPSSVQIQARDYVSGRTPDVFGVGETVSLSVTFPLGQPAPAVRWEILKGPGTLLHNPASGNALFQAGDLDGQDVADTQLALRGPGIDVRRTVHTVPPDLAVMKQYPNTQIAHAPSSWSVGFIGQMSLENSRYNVSFSGLKFSEGSVPAVATGFLAMWNGVEHPEGVPITIGAGSTVNGYDVVFSGKLGGPYTAGDFSWQIPWRYQLGTGPWKPFFTALHHATADAEGTATISKAGAGPFTKRANDPLSGETDAQASSTESAVLPAPVHPVHPSAPRVESAALPQVAHPQVVHPQAVQAALPQTVHPQAVHPQTVHPQTVHPQAARPDPAPAVVHPTQAHVLPVHPHVQAAQPAQAVVQAAQPPSAPAQTVQHAAPVHATQVTPAPVQVARVTSVPVQAAPPQAALLQAVHSTQAHGAPVHAQPAPAPPAAAAATASAAGLPVLHARLPPQTVQAQPVHAQTVHAQISQAEPLHPISVHGSAPAPRPAEPRLPRKRRL